jgi:alkanesulfonate monooxygenase
MTYSAALVACCARTEAELERRAAAIGRPLDELRTTGLAGTPAEVTEKIATYAEAGVQRIYLQTWDLTDLDHLELLAADVLPQVS